MAGLLRARGRERCRRSAGAAGAPGSAARRVELSALHRPQPSQAFPVCYSLFRLFLRVEENFASSPPLTTFLPPTLPRPLSFGNLPVRCTNKAKPLPSKPSAAAPGEHSRP